MRLQTFRQQPLVTYCYCYGFVTGFIIALTSLYVTKKNISFGNIILELFLELCVRLIEFVDP